MNYYDIVAAVNNQLSYKITAGDNLTVAEFTIGPFLENTAVNYYNTIRRTLLRCIPGTAVKALRILGVPSEQTPLDMCKEDFLDIVMHLKQLRVFVDGLIGFETNLVLTANSLDSERVTVTAGDIMIPKDINIRILNPDLYLFTLDAGKQITAEITVRKDYDLRRNDLSSPVEYPSDIFLLEEVLYSPVCQVGHEITPIQVPGEYIMENLILRIETNGTLTPSDALLQSFDRLAGAFTRFASPAAFVM